MTFAARRLPNFRGPVVRLVTAVLVMAALAGPAARGDEASRLRVLLVVDTNAHHAMTLAVDQSALRVRRALEDGLRRQGLGSRYTLDVLAGKDVTPRRILDYYQNLESGPSEALLFYYVGHGAITPGNEHYLATSGDRAHGPYRLPRAELRAAMARHRPRLLVLLTDCCAAPPKSRAGQPRRNPGRTPRPPPLSAWRGDGAVVRQLLFGHRGVVDINAAEIGLLAYGSRMRGGGYFSVPLAALLEQPVSRFDANRDGFVDWQEFFGVLRRETIRWAARSNRRQPPVAFALARPDRSAGDRAEGDRNEGDRDEPRRGDREDPVTAGQGPP